MFGRGIVSSISVRKRYLLLFNLSNQTRGHFQAPMYDSIQMLKTYNDFPKIKENKATPFLDVKNPFSLFTAHYKTITTNTNDENVSGEEGEEWTNWKLTILEKLGILQDKMARLEEQRKAKEMSFLRRQRDCTLLASEDTYEKLNCEIATELNEILKEMEKLKKKEGSIMSVNDWYYLQQYIFSLVSTFNYNKLCTIRRLYRHNFLLYLC